MKKLTEAQMNSSGPPGPDRRWKVIVELTLGRNFDTPAEMQEYLRSRLKAKTCDSSECSRLRDKLYRVREILGAHHADLKQGERKFFEELR